MAENNASEGQEKSFEPTQHKLQKSREKGDVPRSMEVTTFTLYIGIALSIFVAGSIAGRNIFTPLSSMLAKPLDFSQLILMDPNKTGLSHIMVTVLEPLLIFFIFPIVTVILSLVAQRAVVFAPSKIEPKLSKISVISNAKQKYGPEGLMEFAKSFLKLVSILIIVSIFFWQNYLELPALAHKDSSALLLLLKKNTLWLLLLVIIFSGLLAAIDLPWKFYSHHKKLRMTMQEMRDEQKQTEGDPVQKQARQARAMSISTGQMLQDMQTADVVIVNPVHIAVALQWDRSNGSVPVCLAKGSEHIAMRIRERAEDLNIPIYRDVACARSLFQTVEVGEPIQEEHFAAVAAAINFADQMRRKARQSGGLTEGGPHG